MIKISSIRCIVCTRKFWIPLLICSFIGVVAFIFHVWRRPPSISGKCTDCNVILVSLDSLSANHLPCYGYVRNTAPIFCRFAKDNILFRNAYANGRFTLTSHVSLFTGLFPYDHGVNWYGDALSPTIPFLPEILQRNGYTTIFSIPENDSTLPISLVYNRGIDVVYPELKVSWKEILDDFSSRVLQGKKTFLFLHTYAVHYPYLLSDPEHKLYTTASYPDIPLTQEAYTKTSEQYYRDLYKNFENSLDWEQKMSPEAAAKHKRIMGIIRSNNYNPSVLDVLLKDNFWDIYAAHNTVNYTNKFDIHNTMDIDYIQALYDQRIHEMDEQFVRPLLEFLQKEHIRKKTIVIITADHGEEFMEHGEIYHTTLYDSNLRIPLVFSVPGWEKGTEVFAPVSLVDVVPTILDTLGIASGFPYQGKSLADEIQGNSNVKRLIVTEGDVLSRFTIRNSKWKLHVKRDADGGMIAIELFDIVRDPGEQNNVLFTSMQVAQEMLASYSRFEDTWRNN